MLKILIRGIHNLKMAKGGFYAVKAGKKPGIYQTWAECEQQVKGFNNARFKKFPTHQAATEFINGTTLTTAATQAFTNNQKELETPSSKPSSSSSEDPTMSELKTKEVNLPKKRKLESTNFDEVRASSAKVPRLNQPNISGLRRLQNSKFMQKKTQLIAARAKAFSNSESSSTSSETQIDKDSVIIYTDGACTNNGQKGAKAGFGVYWGPNHPLNASIKLTGRPTNNRAEIHAVIHALKQAKENGHFNVILHTDSQFLINGTTKWVNSWIKKGWKLSTGQPVKNKEDFQELEEAKKGMKIKWVYVRGHSGILGNEEADRLAVEGINSEISL